jgi:hypothetical protein
MMRGTAIGALLFMSCASPELSSDSQDLNLPKFAAVFQWDSRANLLQTTNTQWTLTKTAAVDTGAKTVTWNIASTKGATSGNKLTVDGYLDVINLGTGPASLGNIVVNLQAKQGNKWVTLSSDVADATQDDAATSAHVVGADTTEGVSLFSENAASGKLSFTDRRFDTMFSLVPEASIQPWTDLPLVFSASYDNTVLNLATNAQLRFEVVVSFGNHPLGGPIHTDENIDINGNGIIDADEHKVRSIASLFTANVPAPVAANATLALSDGTSDISTTGTVTYSNATFNIGTTTGTVEVSYDPGTSGGSVTNCVHGTGTGVSQTVGSFTFVDVGALALQTCTTATIAQPACTPGAVGCGWHDGDVVSFDQNAWSEPITDGPPSSLLDDELANEARFAQLEPLGITIGTLPTFHADFATGDDLLAYLPQAGPPGVLTVNLADPHITSSGIFGGQIAALRLNVDYTDGGDIHGTAAVKFGDLTLCNVTPAGLNGTSIRSLLPVANQTVGGGVSAYSPTDLSALLMAVNAAFQNGFVSTFAQQHVFNGACPP